MTKELTYDDNIKIWKETYQNIVATYEKYEWNNYGREFSDIKHMFDSAKNHLLLIDWYEKYGLKISHEHKPYQNSYFETSYNCYFSYYNDAAKDEEAGNGKYISWSDDGKQPLNEWLFVINYPTGAFIFGDDYELQRQLFNELFDELKTYNPDYSDTRNHSLYWKLENAKDVYDNYKVILDKYNERNRNDFVERKKAKLREELKKLEQS